MAPEKDCFNYLNLNNPKARDTVLEMMLEFELIDCWREEHIEEIKYTWLKKNPIKQARLDFFLISSLLYAKVEKSDILPAKWIHEGEKPTNYFCNLENRNFVSKAMNKLYSKNGTLLVDQKLIINETMRHFKDLYTEKMVKKIDLNEFFLNDNINKVTDNDKARIEGKITSKEMLECLKKMRNDSSPGSSGFTTAFYKFFWNDIGGFLVRAVNFAFESGELSVTLKQGIITCIPKGDKDKLYLKNWRPISLLNVSYKMASAVIANRLKTVLSYIISEDQTGFLPGRFIGDNIRLLYDVIYYTEQFNIPGLVLTIDFATAFDSISWQFMLDVLKFFNFGEDILKWITLFY